MQPLAPVKYTFRDTATRIYDQHAFFLTDGMGDWCEPTSPPNTKFATGRNERQLGAIQQFSSTLNEANVQPRDNHACNPEESRRIPVMSIVQKRDARCNRLAGDKLARPDQGRRPDTPNRLTLSHFQRVVPQGRNDARGHAFW